MNWEFSKAILRNIAWKYIQRSKTARKPKYRHIKSKTKLAFVMISYSKKLLWIMIFRRDSCPSEWTQREELLWKKWCRSVWATHKCVELLKSKISTNPNPCNRCVQLKNATLLFYVMIIRPNSEIIQHFSEK